MLKEKDVSFICLFMFTQIQGNIIRNLNSEPQSDFIGKAELQFVD